MGEWWMWTGFFSIVLVLLWIDIRFVGGGKAHKVSLKEAGIWQGESVNILLNFTQFFETRIEYRFQIFTAHSCDFLLPSYARLA